MKRHPALEALLKLRGRTGVLLLEQNGSLLALFHLEGDRLLKATGLVALAPEIPSGNLHQLLQLELALLRQVEEKRGWYEAWRLVAEQLTLSLFALRALPGRKRLSFAATTVPEAVRRYGAGYPLREDVLALFLDSKGRGEGEEWEDAFAWS
jgi:hypothetical protein